MAKMTKIAKRAKMAKIAKISKTAKIAKMANKWHKWKKWHKLRKMAKMAKIPKMAKMPKNGKNGKKSYESIPCRLMLSGRGGTSPRSIEVRMSFQHRQLPYGVWPRVNISQTVQANDQTSEFVVNSIARRVSGASQYIKSLK
jgi:hypothetical protein